MQELYSAIENLSSRQIDSLIEDIARKALNSPSDSSKPRLSTNPEGKFQVRGIGEISSNKILDTVKDVLSQSSDILRRQSLIDLRTALTIITGNGTTFNYTAPKKQDGEIVKDRNGDTVLEQLKLTPTQAMLRIYGKYNKFNRTYSSPTHNDTAHPPQTPPQIRRRQSTFLPSTPQGVASLIKKFTGNCKEGTTKEPFSKGSFVLKSSLLKALGKIIARQSYRSTSCAAETYRPKNYIAPTELLKDLHTVLKAHLATGAKNMEDKDIEKLNKDMAKKYDKYKSPNSSVLHSAIQSEWRKTSGFARPKSVITSHSNVNTVRQRERERAQTANATPKQR